MVNLDKFLNVDGIVVRRQLLIDNEVRLFKFPIFSGNFNNIII